MSRLDVGIQFFAPAYGSLRWYLDGKKIGSEEVSAAFGDVNAVVDGTTVTVLWNEAVLTSHDYGVELDMVTYEQDGDNGNVYAISKKSTGEPTLIVNGTTIQTVIVNGTEVANIVCNDTLVFDKTGVTEPLSVEPTELLSELNSSDTQPGIVSGETVTAKISGGTAPYTAKFTQKSGNYSYSDNDTKVASALASRYYIVCSVVDDILSVTSYDSSTFSYLGGDWEIVITDANGSTISATTSFIFETCFTGDSLITMADGTQKRIDQIQRGDYVLSMDENGEFVPGYVYYSDSDANKTHTHYDRFVFSDGTEVKVVHRHRFYNMEEQKFVHLDAWYIGDHALKENGDIVELTEKHLRDYEGDPINHYTIFCKHNIYFANGIMCGNRFSEPVLLGEPATVDADGNIVEEPKAYYPIQLNLPKTFSGYTDAWIDDTTKDLMLMKDGRTINYYQIGYDNSYGAFYKRPDGVTENDYDDIINNWEKICELTHEHVEGNLTGKEFDVIIVYIERVMRNGTSSVSDDSGGGTLPNGAVTATMESSSTTAAPATTTENSGVGQQYSTLYPQSASNSYGVIVLTSSNKND